MIDFKHEVNVCQCINKRRAENGYQMLVQLYQSKWDLQHQNANFFLFVTARILVHFALIEWECLVKKSKLQVHVQKYQVNFWSFFLFKFAFKYYRERFCFFFFLLEDLFLIILFLSKHLEYLFFFIVPWVNILRYTFHKYLIKNK